LPHVPQLFGSLAKLAQNVGAATGQAVWLSVHPHALDTHAIPDAHVFPHVPQFAGSVARSAQYGVDVPHFVIGDRHDSVHTPPMQLVPALHTVVAPLHPPQ
jgi:hypothetical protein